MILRSLGPMILKITARNINLCQAGVVVVPHQIVGVTNKTDMWNSCPYSIVPMFVDSSNYKGETNLSSTAILSMTFQAECLQCQQPNSAYYEAKPGN